MSITEVFPNPAVKNVIYQIKFPNLFYLENKIGDIQEQLMGRFPHSNLLYRQQIVFADISPGEKPMQPFSESQGNKTWRFTSKDESVVLNILNDSLDISSSSHKTYDLGNESENKFRETIEFILQNFLNIIKIPLINRIGLRYINEIPFPAMTNKLFQDYFNSILPVEKYDLANIKSMESVIAVSKDPAILQRRDLIHQEQGNIKLVLDFDAYQEEIESSNFLTVTDYLHDIINETFEDSIKEPVIDYMRREPDEAE